MITSLDFSGSFGFAPWILAVVLVWSIVWMGIGMWIAARKRQPIWFVIFLIIHTLGILEILYIFIFSKISMPSSAPRSARPARKKRR